MKLRQRNGVLGLETSKAVMISFLILAVTGVAVILALSTLDDAVGESIDRATVRKNVVNDTGFLNTTTYTLSGYNSSWSSITLTFLWNVTDDGGGTYNLSLLLPNATLSSVGVIQNASSVQYNDTYISYYYTYTYDSGKMDSIVGNVTGGIETFFASTGTIFSILIVVVIILAISIIIWAVGRFGQVAEAPTDL